MHTNESTEKKERTEQEKRQQEAEIGRNCGSILNSVNLFWFDITKCRLKCTYPQTLFLQKYKIEAVPKAT